MRRALLFCAAIVFAIACGDDITEPIPDRTVATPPVAFATTTAEDGLSITTDKDDYAPGDTVWFTGAGWPGNDTLDIVLEDEPATHEPHTWWVPVDETGGFRDSTYVVDVGDLGVTFTLTATSRATGRSLTVVFTDGNIRIRSNLPGVTFTVTATKYVGSGNCTTGALAPTTPTIGSSPTTFTANPAGGGPNPSPVESYKFVAAANSDQSPSAAFVNWTTTDPVVSNVGNTLCVVGFNGTGTYTANYNAAPDLTATKSTNTTTFTKDADGVYVIRVTNAGNANTSGTITVKDTLAAGLTFKATPGQYGQGWNCSSATGGLGELIVTCTRAGGGGQDLAPAAFTDVSITVTVGDAACPSVQNRATVSGGGETNTSNDASNTTTTDVDGCNQPPEVDAGGPYSGDEGSDIALNEATASDPDDDPLDYTWTINYGANPEGATCTFKDPNNASNPTPHKVLHPSINCNDNGTFTVRLTVSDGIASPVYDEAQLTVDNVPPDITAVVVLPFVDGYVYPITGQPTVDATYTDQGSHDTHTCMFEVFDYQNIEVGTDRTCGASLGVTEAGVYTVKVTVTDDDGGSDYETIQVVVYDPSAGFVTGGGWIYSAAGAYKADMSLEGKATFGFVSKYITQKDKTTPVLTGNTEFVFHAGNLNFNSSSYEWLVVNGIGTRAQYKGKGTINGGGVLYPFILTAVDGKTGGTDQFRMQIFQTDGETVLYDNYVSGPATEQPLGSGSIVIHVPKKTT
jgi:hypothetical protein